MPNVLITGAGRRAGIAAACAVTLARAGWDVGLSCWRLYDRETGPASVDREPIDLVDELRDLGVRAELSEADLSDPAAPARLFDELEGRLGRFTALVAAHCRDIELPLLGTSAEEFDRHFAVNAGRWLCSSRSLHADCLATTAGWSRSPAMRSPTTSPTA